MKKLLAALTLLCSLTLGGVVAMPLYGCGSCDCEPLPLQVNVMLEDGTTPAALTGMVNAVDVDCSGGCSLVELEDVRAAGGMVEVNLTDGTESFRGFVPVQSTDTCCGRLFIDVTLR